ncbi:bifunctional [glutamate--ammonia ligase]-adenylyl-L-tyrosine phosphorylase/[glutamate--ammonia-ligase] adenylyltransferase [Paraferrimonas sp. SM1919]|uniref:bifunctional [glutamate--ammonia ligase]-adenylyl-L-tyrosine phosphorylase/[glutamate--ammonia-ligase] adenylyltransferase n=1 Tax=Paraferrimonas sp. SM1919 TaxID=2662263 RepID=UPI0013D3D64C|nr:bifunctional [glutamate--ammonia ligase]-adenylyl-L-tyrosine phosphorylase/[glutamate--ammonia-ligase] adenylyltransferase [Paraferrimonas sp. SM1919]
MSYDLLLEDGLKAINKLSLSPFDLTATQVEQLQRFMGFSPFAAKFIQSNVDFVNELLCLNDDFSANYESYVNELNRQLSGSSSEAETMKLLRVFRHRQLITIIWLDFFKLQTQSQILLLINRLAEAIIIAARDWLTDFMLPANGRAYDASGQPMPLIILGMGKLGGGELNLSSDIDLIFTFAEHGNTKNGRRSLEHQQYFIRLGQKLINLLHQVTVDGFCYRVDMRLRPFGDSGPLVISFTALEDYYQNHGRDWERYAMVKARALGAICEGGKQVEQLLRPFVYRRYIDFSAIESLRKMKASIAQELRRRNLKHNIKLGSGGIREVEFIVQSLQLIRGGREPKLRRQSLFAAMKQLISHGMYPETDMAQLLDSYLLLRRLENLLQGIDDKQTQTLPNLEDELNWQRLNCAFGCRTSEQLLAIVTQAMTIVHQQFVFAIGDSDSEDEQLEWSQELWQSHSDEAALQILQEHDLVGQEFWQKLKQWRVQLSKRSMGSRGRETLDKLMPALLVDFSTQPDPTAVFDSITHVLDRILTRTAYLELLLENAGARQQLLKLCQASPYIAELIAKFPLLLDDLIDPSLLYQTTALEDYQLELQQYLLRIPEEDLEQQMEALRQFKLSQQLKIAAADITGVLPLMQVSDHLTYLAEAIVSQVVELAWKQITERFGIPAGLAPEDKGFAVIGYGKLGGIELGYGSDLDLVFLHFDGKGDTQGGRKPISVHEFYLKLAQRILHLFSTRTPSGILYEVDMRLRPSGSGGLLVSNINRFAEYQLNEAWTWEHQALVRTRLIGTNNSLQQDFDKIKQQILSIPREPQQLLTEVVAMRSKMREHLIDAKAGEFDLKQSPGGITDIEFMVQYLVLKHANQYPQLCRWSDNIRLLDELAQQGILERNTAIDLIDSYCKLRDESHRRSLQPNQSKALPASLITNIELVAQTWQDLMHDH